MTFVSRFTTTSLLSLWAPFYVKEIILYLFKHLLSVTHNQTYEYGDLTTLCLNPQTAK